LPRSPGGRVAAENEYAFIAAERDGVTVISTANPGKPTIVARYRTFGSAARLQVVGDYVYVADGDGGLAILRLERTKP
jgi:hypothetical protein